MNIGYARVSTDEQNLDSQRDALEKADCQLIFTDQVSGTKEKPEDLALMMHSPIFAKETP